jgi:hypothetical protein
MSALNIDLPHATAVEAALRTTTEALARELAQPTQRAPDWSDFEWLVARAVAAMHGVSPLLSDTLRWRGPEGWSGFLQEQKAQTVARHPRIMELLRHIDARARDYGIAVVALKGAELHSSGLYAPGQRPMADVDLLVQGKDLNCAARMLESLGFHESLSTWRDRVFIPEATQAPRGLGEHADNYLKVELHDRIQEALPVDIVDVSGRVFPSRAHTGLNPYPSRASLMVHLVLHAAGAMVSRTLRLLHLNDLALLSSRMTDADWNEVLEHGASGREHWWALPPLQLASRYYAGTVPTRVLAALADECPPMLGMIARRRTLSDVSLSSVWIQAFPGIEWSRSLSETARYIMRRVAPSTEQLELRRGLAKTEVAPSASQWHHLPQRRRMLRWLTSRQPRADTMHAVRMALAQAQ